MMNLGQLRSFAEVAERGTAAAAASALGFTPPAISQHIAKLEAELGIQLFDRVARRLRLTVAGEALLPVALDMLDLERQGKAIVSQPLAVPHYVVAGFASALDAVLVPQLQRIEDHMTLEIVEAEDAEALRDLRLGTIDLVLTQEYHDQPAERDPRLSFLAVATDRLRLIAPPDLSDRTTISQLGDHPWLVNGRGTRCTDATTRLLAAHALAPKISASVADNNTMLRLVSAGHGVTVVPELVLAGSQANVTVTAQDLGMSRTILAVHRTSAADSIAPLLALIAGPVTANG